MKSKSKSPHRRASTPLTASPKGRPAPRRKGSRPIGGRGPSRSGDEPRSRSGGQGPSWPRSWRAIIGNHAILEVLKVRPRSIQQVWLKQGWESVQDLNDMGHELKNRGVKVDVVPASYLDKVSPSHQGAAVFSDESPEINWSEVHAATQGQILVLDGIEDPQNLGAILRTSWLMGVSGVMIPEDRSVGLTATVHKVACGGVEHMPIERTTNFANPIEDLKKNGYWVFGLSHEGKRSLFELQIPEKVVWCIGSEEKGLRIPTERLCDELIRIPQISAAASYNASVATAIALTETFRQQSQKKD